jgi:hypothetical protein
VTDEELLSYIGQDVELKLKSNGVLAGKLAAGDTGLVLLEPYAPEQLPAAATSNTVNPPHTKITGGDAVEWIRSVSVPLDDADLAD